MYLYSLLRLTHNNSSSLMQNSRKNGRDGARPSRRYRKRPICNNGGTASVPSAGVLQEARSTKEKEKCP